jgi:hypothetical protein
MGQEKSVETEPKKKRERFTYPGKACSRVALNVD